MGINNKQRRAAKQKRRAQQRAQRSGRGPGGGSPRDDGGFGPWQSYAFVELAVVEAVRGLVRRRFDEVELRRRTGWLFRNVAPTSLEMVGTVLGDVLVDVVHDVVSGGWDPHDLAQLVRRHEQAWLPKLAAALHEHVRSARGAGDIGPSEIRAIADDERLLLRSCDDIAEALGLAATLAGVPLLDPEALAAARRAGHRPVEHPKWHQARALLAKAESTDFGPEAEALVAKAQELISRYALEQLLESHHNRADNEAREAPLPRRLWLDRPYTRAKAALVDEVARANHCRAAFAESNDFVLLVGHQADLDAVDLLVTSLLAQADVAMMRLGRSDGAAGSRARSRSFRQSFLMAYAFRVGERLDAAKQSAVGDYASALPVLRDHETRVSDAFEAMVPHTAGRAVNVSDYAGWQAGTDAADLALLDVYGRLPAEGAPSTRTG